MLRVLASPVDARPSRREVVGLADFAASVEMARRGSVLVRGPGQQKEAFLEVEIEDVMAGRPAVEREIVSLRLCGWKYREIAAKLGVSQKTIAKILRRLRCSLSGG